MQVDKLSTFFESSPIIRLLKSDHAPYVIDFLYQNFKTAGAISLGQTELRTCLILYQEELHAASPEKLVGTADTYLRTWSDAGWLKRTLTSESNEPQFQLTQYSEDAIQFVDLSIARRTGLVGTESRLRLVIDTLADLVRGASSDPQRRLEYLEDQKETMQREIDAIRLGGPVIVYKPATIRERFRMAVDLLKTLQGDFRAVEERFHSIARDVQKRQQSASDRRGEILGGALDAEDVLKTEDEGISFYAFVSFLFSPEGQNELRETINEVVKLEPIQDQRGSIEHLRKMLPSLLKESDKVLKTTSRLSSTLRKLLDPRTSDQHKQLTDLLSETKQLALQLRDDPPQETIVEVQSSSGPRCSMARTFWKPPQTFDDTTPEDYTFDLEKSLEFGAELASMQRLDLEKLRSNISRLLDEPETEEALSMQQVIDAFPPKSGIMELIGYLQIAHEDHCEIHPELKQELTVFCSQRNVSMKVVAPQVLFRRNDLKRKKPR